MGRFEEDLKELGIKSEGRRDAAQNADRSFRRVDDGSEACLVCAEMP